jgi:hypothetical protein
MNGLNKSVATASETEIETDSPSVTLRRLKQGATENDNNIDRDI